MANKKVLMAFSNLFKDWVFLMQPGRSFHNLGGGGMERSIAERGDSSFSYKNVVKKE